MVIIINVSGLLLIAFIVWWFWIPKKMPAVKTETGIIEITVENGIYTPAHIQLKAGEPVTLRFLRKDSTPCASMVIFDELEISEELPLNAPKDIAIKPKTAGKIHFACQMKMYRGDLTVIS